jgi:hypothetical protein
MIQATGRNWQTFSTIATQGVHWESITCEQAGCEKRANGFKVLLDESLRLGALRADYIRRVTLRRGWTEHRDDAGVTVFVFPPGTPCFCDGRDQRAQPVMGCGPHRRKTRPMLHVVAAGKVGQVAGQINRAGRPGEILRVHNRPGDWAEHAAESWNRMADAINR